LKKMIRENSLFSAFASLSDIMAEKLPGRLHIVPFAVAEMASRRTSGDSERVSSASSPEAAAGALSPSTLACAASFLSFAMFMTGAAFSMLHRVRNKWNAMKEILLL